jgi:hypothetical protein
VKSISFNRLNISQQFLIIAMGSISIILVGVSTYMIKTSISSKNEQIQVMTNGRAGGAIEKIDRNFYERFGDVQAFAFNKLAVETVTKDAPSSEDMQKFINTMVSYYVLYDLMMVCNLDGKVMAVNTMNTSGEKINTNFLIGKNVANEEWFKNCVATTGPEGGAWYSDFIENRDVSSIYGRTGWGMAFAAPIKNNEGSPIGVWYNFANWQLVTTDIRKETENAINQSHPGSFVLITNSEDVVIDSDDHKMLLSSNISIDGLNEGAEFEYKENKVSASNYVMGGVKGVGAYTYKGKNWNAITFIPQAKFSFSYLIENLLGFLSVIIVLLIIIAIVFYRLASSISKSINRLKNNVENLSRGELVQVEETNLQNEIGAMTIAVKSLVMGMNSTSQFAMQIGEGNLSTNFRALSEKDVLGHSLLSMRDNLLKIREEEHRRSWVTNGLAKIGEILRTNFTSSSELYDGIINFVVKYIHSNQGGLFLLSEDAAESSLSLVACRAYERKKFLEKRIASGEGLVGQCFLEREMIYMTSVPKNYTFITSGLGGATPTAIILVPLKVNESIVGVLELASLIPYEQHERELLQKFAESIASTISTVRINDRTRQLLEQSQQLAEEMKSQEEEMRQNMEELSATQEEMVRKEQEYLKRIAELQMASLK